MEEQESKLATQLELRQVNRTFLRWKLICILGICIVIFGIPLVILLPIFASAKSAATRVGLLSNVKRVTTTWWVYASDFDDRSCSIAGWNAALSKYWGDSRMVWSDVLKDPFLENQVEQRGIGLNPSLSFVKISNLDEPKYSVAFAVTKRPGGDAQVTQSSVRPVFGTTTVMSFADGHARFLKLDNSDPTFWNPSNQSSNAR